MLLRERCFEHGLCHRYPIEIWRDQELNDVYRRVTLRVPRMTATLVGMRVIIALALLAVATPASADSYVGLAAGVAVPVSDESYTDAVNNSPVLGLRVGSSPGAIGGYLSFEWTPIDAEADDTPGIDVSAHRFRILVGPEFQHPVSNTLAVTGRAGVGIDIAHASYTADTIIGRFESSETDMGLALEFGGGVWFRLGGLQVGGELSLPISIHDDDPDERDFDYDYTAIDVQLLAGIRFVSH
jgi:hypothetical protein